MAAQRMAERADPVPINLLQGLQDVDRDRMLVREFSDGSPLRMLFVELLRIVSSFGRNPMARYEVLGSDNDVPASTKMIQIRFVRIIDESRSLFFTVLIGAMRVSLAYAGREAGPDNAASARHVAFASRPWIQCPR